MPSPRTAICLIRHGETLWNREGRWQGHADPDLTDAGREAARELARQLLEEHRERPFTQLFASDLLRARSTAAPIAAATGLPLALDPRLRELDVGTWSGLTRGEIESRHGETLRAFERGEPGVRPGGGECRIEIRERAHAFVSARARDCAGGRVLVVTHLGVIRALIPGASPGNVDRFEIVAEEIAARSPDRMRRREQGPL